MIYSNKFYAIEDIAKKLKIKEKDIRVLIDLGVISTEDMYGVGFLKGDTVLSLHEEVKKFNQSLKEGKLPQRKFKNKKPEKGAIEILKGGLIGG